MSSRRTSAAVSSDGAPGAQPIGLAFGFRLGSYYALFFAVVTAALFGATYLGVSSAIRDREMEIVRNKAAEYRAWYLEGGIAMLEARLEEQALASGDLTFVRIDGDGSDFVQFYGGRGAAPPLADVRALDSRASGAALRIGSGRWAVASLGVDGSEAVLQAGRSGRAGEATLAQIRKVFVAALVLGSVAIVVGGGLLTYRALVPIRRLIVAMREILSGGDLGRRAEPERGRNELNALVDLFNRLLERNETLIDAMHGSLDSVAHDMRTPLTRLKNTAESALREGGTIDEVREALADCAEESEELGTLLDTLMDVAEAESGAMRLRREPLSLPDLIAGVVDLYEFVAEEAGVELVTELPGELEVSADRTRLSQAIANLVDNAIKYSRRGGRVTVTAEMRADGMVEVSVRDRGIGINEADLPFLWDRLFRAERSRTTPGAGLGLSMVKAIVEAHGGRIGVHSVEGEGSTFTVLLEP